MRAESKLRNDDIRLSDKVSAYLDEVFYDKETSDFERIVDKERQVQGIDTIFTYNGRQYLCDEKAAVRYRNLRTYTLELSFVNKHNEVQEGWLTSDKEKNDSFLLIWLDDDGVDIALIQREKIMEHLSSMGWTKEALRTKEKRIRTNPYEAMGDLSKNGCRFIISRHLVEKPINIQMSKETYIKLSDFHKKYYTDIFKSDEINCVKRY